MAQDTSHATHGKEPQNRRVFLACHNTLQKQEPMAAILDFLQREGCIITSMDDFEGADYEAMYAAIEQSDVFISVLDELIYSTQALLLLIHACSSQRRSAARRRLVTPNGLNYAVWSSPRPRNFRLLLGPETTSCTGLTASDHQQLSTWPSSLELETLDLNRLSLLLEDLPPPASQGETGNYE